jgi:hypothetical protein
MTQQDKKNAFFVRILKNQRIGIDFYEEIFIFVSESFIFN